MGIVSGEVGCYIRSAEEYMMESVCDFDAYKPTQLRIFVQNESVFTDASGHTSMPQISCGFSDNPEGYSLWCWSCKYDEAESSGSMSYYDCNIQGLGYVSDTEEGTIPKGITVEMPIRYVDRLKDTISDSKDIDIIKEKSPSLNLLETEKETMENILKWLRITRNIIIGIAALAAAFCIAMWIACPFGCSWCCTAGGICLRYGICVEINLIGLIIGLQGWIEDIKAQLGTLNVRLTGDVGEYSTENKAIGWAVAGGIVEIVGFICDIVTVNLKTPKVPAISESSLTSGVDFADFIMTLA